MTADDDDDDDDDSSAPPSLATSSGSDDDEEDRARFEEPEESEETENATRRTNPRTNSERAARSRGGTFLFLRVFLAAALAGVVAGLVPGGVAAGGARRSRERVRNPGNPGTRSHFSPAEALNGVVDPGEETRTKKKSAAAETKKKPSSSRDVAKPSSPDTNPRRDPEAKKEDKKEDPPADPSQATPPQFRRKRFSEKVALARALARAGVAKNARALAAHSPAKKDDADSTSSGSSGSSSASPSSPSRSALLLADRDAQLAYFRTRPRVSRRRRRRGLHLGLALDPRVSRARVREEASGWLGVDEKKRSGTLFDMWDGVARRAVDDVTRLEWLLDEPLTRRVWRYENTVRVCASSTSKRSGGTTEGDT